MQQLRCALPTSLHTGRMQKFDGISTAGEEYDQLVDRKGDEPHHKKGPGHVRITRFAKAVFGLGFCAENMFDVAGDTLLTKFYAGARGAGCVTERFCSLL